MYTSIQRNGRKKKKHIFSIWLKPTFSYTQYDLLFEPFYVQTERHSDKQQKQKQYTYTMEKKKA